MKPTRSAAITLGLLFLTACGSGGTVTPVASIPAPAPPMAPQVTRISDIPWQVEDPAAARSFTGGIAPVPTTSAQIGARLTGLKNGADALILTDLHDPTFAFVGYISTYCLATTCVTSDGLISLWDSEFHAGEHQSVMTKNGVQTVQSRDLSTIDEGTLSVGSYGAWMNYNAFSIEASLVEYPDGNAEAIIVGRSFGDATGSSPVRGAATWEGVMIGEDFGFDGTVQGDASVTVDFTEIDADVSFTNVFNLDAKTAIGSMHWSNLVIGPDGRFGSSDIKATFYGRNHEEVGGVFERNNIVGAFGATRE